MTFNTVIIGFLLLGLMSCSNSKQDEAISNKDSVASALKKTYTRFKEKDLITFLDSIGKIDNALLLPKETNIYDSIFYNVKHLNKELSQATFQKLCAGLKNGKLNKIIAREIFTDPIDSVFLINEEVEITYHSFDKNKNKFNEFAIRIGSETLSRENDIYFFHGKKLIAKQRNYHKNESNISHFTDADGKTIIYYAENFGSGSGIWQYNYFFYKYVNDSLIPVLNILQNGNLQFSNADNRHFWLESFILKTKPLTVKFVYNYSLNNNNDSDFTEIVNDSTEIIFMKSETGNSFNGKFNDKLKRAQLLTYYIGFTDVYQINTDYLQLKTILKSSDTSKRKSVLTYLNRVKNNIQKGYYN